MKITDIKTFLMQAGSPPNSGAWAANYATISTGWRNWLFVKIYTDEGITGVGECSGWPRVIETAVHDLKHVLIGEDPANIEKLWQKMLAAMMGHGMTGVVGGGAMTGVDMALWDIKGKALNTPVWNLLGGKLRDRVRIYAHAKTPEVALQLKAAGITAIKAGGTSDPVRMLEELRAAIGDEMDLMVDLHGPPWLTASDAIVLGRRLEPLSLLFMEDPVPPEHLDSYARIRDAVAIPLAAGERAATIWGERPLIERELVDVIQPDTGRAGGITQMKKIAAMAEAHGIMLAPHSGSLGPVAEYAALHIMAAVPNALMLERVEIDWAGRAEVITPVPHQVDGYLAVPDAPGLGVDIVEDAVARYPSKLNVGMGKGDYEPGTEDEFVYVQTKLQSRAVFFPALGLTRRPTAFRMAVTLPFVLRPAREVFGCRTLFASDERSYLSTPPNLWNWRCRSATETRRHFAHFAREKVPCPREVIIEFRDAVLIDGKYVLSRERAGVGESFADVWGDEEFASRMTRSVATIDSGSIESIRDVGLPVLHICKEGAENFGHLVVEILPKLVHASAIGVRQCRVPLPAAAAMMQPLIVYVGSLLGMEFEFFHCPQNSILRIERLLWCGPVSRHNSRKSPTLLALADRLLANAPPAQSTGALYVTRPPDSFRQITNNAEVEDCVRQRGYTVVEPSRLPLREQIALFRGASIVVGPIGAGLTHAVFMPAETRVGMLDHGLCDRFYWDLACLKGQEFTWMFMDEVKPFERRRIMAPYSVNLAVPRSALDWFECASEPAA